MAFQPRIVIDNERPEAAPVFRTHGTPREQVLDPGQPYFGRKLCAPDATALTPVAWESVQEPGKWHIGLLREEWCDGMTYLQGPAGQTDLRLVETLDGETTARARVDYLGQSMLYSQLKEMLPTLRPVAYDDGSLPFAMPRYGGGRRASGPRNAGVGRSTHLSVV